MGNLLIASAHIDAPIPIFKCIFLLRQASGHFKSRKLRSGWVMSEDALASPRSEDVLKPRRFLQWLWLHFANYRASVSVLEKLIARREGRHLGQIRNVDVATSER